MRQDDELVSVSRYVGESIFDFFQVAARTFSSFEEQIVGREDKLGR